MRFHIFLHNVLKCWLNLFFSLFSIIYLYIFSGRIRNPNPGFRVLDNQCNFFRCTFFGFLTSTVNLRSYVLLIELFLELVCCISHFYKYFMLQVVVYRSGLKSEKKYDLGKLHCLPKRLK